jgi:hypothetical protein
MIMPIALVQDKFEYQKDADKYHHKSRNIYLVSITFRFVLLVQQVKDKWGLQRCWVEKKS